MQPGTRLLLSSLSVALAVLTPSPAGGRATAQFADYPIDFYQCASLDAGKLVLKVCEGGCPDIARARMLVTLPGTLIMDLHYEATSSNWGDLTIDTASYSGSFASFPACSPCSGDTLGIPIAVQANDIVTFQLYRSEFGCLNGDPITCTFSNLQFIPATGVSVLGGALDAAPLLNVDPGSIALQEGVGPLALLGDVNGDGRGDVACGMSNWGPPDNSGKVRVLSGATGTVLHEWLGTNSNSRLGSTLGNAGDVDGDGLDDVVASETSPDRARVLSAATGAELFTLTPTAVAPYAVDGAGDVDGDGRGDIVIGAKNAHKPGASTCGKVYVYSGATHELLHEAAGDFTQDQLGGFVSGAGDVDADGFDDYLATAPSHPLGSQSNGLVRVYSGLTGLPLHSFVGQNPIDFLGACAGGAGDFNADGHADIVAAGQGTGGFGDAVRVFSGATGAMLFSTGGVLPNEVIGGRVAGAGDLNGDGFDDILVTAQVIAYNHPYLRAFGGPAGTPLFVRHSLDYTSYGDLDGGRDADGDGTPDYLIEAQTGLDGQRLFVYSGAPALQAAPVLAATGSLLPSSPFRFDLTGGPAGGTALVILGGDAFNAPFKGGFLIPTVTLIVGALPLGPAGALHLNTSWPPGVVSPAVIVMQAWLPKPSALHGVIATNGLLLAPP